MRSSIEQYIIDRVREIRIAEKVSQADLSYRLGFESTSYIGEIESAKPGNTESYNINHLNEIAKILKCSPKVFWPDMPL